MEKGLTEEMIFDLKNEIGSHEGLQKLGIKLKFTLLEMIEYDKVNKKNPFEGTVKMLSQWRKDTETKKQISLLKTALISAGLKGVARSFFKELEKMDKAAKKAQLSKEGKAGTSTAAADIKPKPKGKPAKNPAQKGSKIMETKSAKKVSHDGSKPGASTLKKSTYAGGNGKSGAGINAPKKSTKTKNATEEKDAPPNKTRKIESTTTQGDVSMNMNTSGSANSRGNKMTGKEVNINIS